MSGKINTKTIARIAAIQSVYQYQGSDKTISIDRVTENILSFYQNRELVVDLEVRTTKQVKVKPSIGYFKELVKLTIEHLEQIDQVITGHLSSGWTIEKLPKILLAILEVAICELKFFPEVPTKVIINEYTDIASDMASDQEIAFVNSVLDKVGERRGECF